MNAWLITWEWSNDYAAVADKVVGILNPRWGIKRVLDIVEFLYANTNYRVNELAKYAKKPTSNPHKARIYQATGGRIVCGHNPWIEARIVSDLKIEINDDEIELISWKELPIYKYVNGKKEMERGPLPKQFTRRIKGPVSHKNIWDHINNKFINGWGAGETPNGN